MAYTAPSIIHTARSPCGTALLNPQNVETHLDDLLSISGYESTLATLNAMLNKAQKNFEAALATCPKDASFSPEDGKKVGDAGVQVLKWKQLIEILQWKNQIQNLTAEQQSSPAGAASLVDETQQEELDCVSRVQIYGRPAGCINPYCECNN